MSAILGAVYIFVSSPILNMRELPTKDSEVVSQTYFSEEVVVKEECDDWIKIATSDNYLGWVQKGYVVNLPERYETTLKTSRLSSHIYEIKDTTYGPKITVPFGSRLKLLDGSDPRWFKIALPDGQECYIQKGDVAEISRIDSKEGLVDFSMRFIGLPYTWGGRSSFGFDCSGFVQMLYKQIGVELPRDSKQQVCDERFRTVSVDDLEEGDLIFFGKSEHHIGHVGLYIGGGFFTHSAVEENQPWIRKSHLTDPEWSGIPDAYYPYRTARQLIKE